MARKNKKRNGGFLFPLPFALALILVSSFGIGYIWLGCRCESVGRRLKRLEDERSMLERQLRTEQYRWAQMKSPLNIERTLARLSIEMGWPTGTQIVHMHTRSPLPPAQVAERMEEGWTLARLEAVLPHE